MTNKYLTNSKYFDFKPDKNLNNKQIKNTSLKVCELDFSLSIIT